jgi:hypothetical protein
MKLELIKENEDGSANYNFDLTETEAVSVIELGLKLIAYCSASGLHPDQVFSWIELQIGHTVKVDRVDEG